MVKARKPYAVKVRPIRLEGDVALVTLSRGKTAIIDAADVGLIDGRNWTSHGGERPYAYRSGPVVNGRQTQIRMHRVVTGARPGDLVDHIDGNPLNNRRGNLRLCTPAQNMWNRGPMSKNRLGMPGVSKAKSGLFKAVIRQAGIKYSLGVYQTAAEASAAYYGAARVLRGPYVREPSK